MISYHLNLGEPSLEERLQKPISSPMSDAESNKVSMAMPAKSVFAQKHNFESEKGKELLNVF